MAGEIVPFGKYKGQPTEALLTDQPYCEWLAVQPWFRDKYATVYQTIINYGGEPQESPEHNEMQARFLDDEWCFGLGGILIGAPVETSQYMTDDRIKDDETSLRFFKEAGMLRYEDILARCERRRFEDSGWDITFHIRPTLKRAWVDRCPDNAGHAQRQWSEREHHYGESRFGCAVECKPDLGDDYPAVLRQVLRYPRDYFDFACVVVRRASFQFVTWEQVVTIFGASGIRLIAESELEAN